MLFVRIRIPRLNFRFSTIRRPERKDWDRLTTVSRIVDQVMEEEAVYLANRVRQGIERQEFRWPPLNPIYLRWKILQGLDPRTLIATGQYVSDISSVRLSDKRYGVGTRTRTHAPSGLPYSQFIRIHEYGLGNVPPRPHWSPVFREYMSDRGRSIRNRIAARIREDRNRVRNRQSTQSTSSSSGVHVEGSSGGSSPTPS